VRSRGIVNRCTKRDGDPATVEERVPLKAALDREKAKEPKQDAAEGEPLRLDRQGVPVEQQPSEPNYRPDNVSNEQSSDRSPTSSKSGDEILGDTVDVEPEVRNI
ncbi:hypothetical protein FRC07_008904, partial [Ceratobasidium sp. 392]